MSTSERPIGAAKGKQSDTKVLCQPPPPSPKQKHYNMQGPEIPATGTLSGHYSEVVKYGQNG